GIEQAKALVMLGRHHDVLLAGTPGEPGPFAGAVGFWVELFCQLLVFGDRDGFVLHRPFVMAQHAVQTPVDEHPESSVVPPLHSSRTVLVFLMARRLFHQPWRCYSTLVQRNQSRSRSRPHPLHILPPGHMTSILTFL